MEWYERVPLRWRKEQEIARRFMKNVQVGFDEQRRAFLLGDVRVESQHGHVYGNFRIRTVYPSSFPERGRVPSVHLESHRDRWRSGGNSHIEEDWRLCLFVPMESGIDFTRLDALERLFACIHTFLIKEYIYQRCLGKQAVTGEPAIWPGEARSHGVRGIREALRERGSLGRNEPCPCGSGRKFKKCHMPELER
jgi:hypothetical protein